MEHAATLAPPVDSIGGSGSPPFVGADVLQLVLERKPGQKIGGEYHLVHQRYAPQPTVVSSVDLGPVGFPVNGCKQLKEDFRVENGQLVVIWPIDNSSMVEQHIPWDGKQLGKPSKPPVQIGSCLEP